MSRRTTDLISLSFFDVLTSALGAVIFLFIIVPKAKLNAVETPVAQVQNTLKDSILMPNNAFSGLQQPSVASSAAISQPLLMAGLTAFPFWGNSRFRWRNTTSTPKNETIAGNAACTPQNTEGGKNKQGDVVLDTTLVKFSAPNAYQIVPKDTNAAALIEPVNVNVSPRAQGTNLKRPSNPCRVAFELKWENPQDNIDLFVYKGDKFVCGKGGYRENPSIGEWDSGKSRNRIFSNDLRTNQEAVRQFSGIIEGEYSIFVVFKESIKPDSTLKINLTGLIYTRNDKGEENSTAYETTVAFNPKVKQIIGKVALKADGQFNFSKP